ncbi:MAG TPA: YbhB/YbcL family Raf kinase inhibitor-like protein [Dehalococcoidia bacterium]|nr:YbhB/YbcL family Raf kinase inhibitor-like protein [Dehalococcoidia bacterium]
MFKRIIVLGIAIISCIILAVLSYGCNCRCGNPHITVYTFEATDIGTDSATLHGQLRNMSSGFDAHVYFLWATDEDALMKVGHIPTGQSNTTESRRVRNDSDIIANLTGLVPDTVYYFQAYASTFHEGTSTSGEYRWGSIEFFTTLSADVGEEEEEEEEEEEPAGEQEEEEEYYTLTISSSENGRVVNPSEGSHTFDEDVVVNLVAEADEGYQFDRWEGDVAEPESASTTITMNADKSVMAYFEPIPPFELTSSAFSDGERMPSVYSKEGGNRSPPLEWTGVPHGTVSFVLVMYDPYGWDEPCDHWIVFNIPADVTSLEEGASSNLPEGASHGTVAGGRTTYYGCYPQEGHTSSYYFTIYALDTMLNLNQGATKQQVLAAMEGYILAEAELVGTYSR